MDEKKTLYCFKLNKQTGEIKKVEITDYITGQWNDRKTYYRFRLDSVVFYAYAQDLDRFKNDRVYSFDGDINHAVDTIYQTLMEKRDKEYKDYKKHYDLMCEIAGLYMNNNEVAT